MSNMAAPMQTARAPPGGKSSLVLGEDQSAWGTTSNAHSNFTNEINTQDTTGMRQPPGGTDSVQLGGPVETLAAKELLARPSPGGTDSIAFGKDSGNSLPAAELLARGSVGGTDSVDFGGSVANPSSEALLARAFPGGPATVVLGGDNAEWSTNSQAHGVGSIEAIASAEARIRQAPGGTDSINFNPEHCNVPAEVLLARPSPGGADSVSFASGAGAGATISSEALLARPYPGGSATVLLGGDTAQWSTNSQVHGVGSVEAVAAAEARVRPAPGGVDSIEFGAEQASLSSEVLLARPSPGGVDKMFLGGDRADWETNTSTVGAGSVEAIAQADPVTRRAPGGKDSVQSINSASTAPLSAQELMARPATGGGGKASVVLGGDSTDWTTSQSETHGPCDIDSREVMVRQGPGGVDSVDFAAADSCKLTVEELLARPATGGPDSINFAQLEGNNVGAAELLARPSPGGHANIVLGSVGGVWATSSQTHGGKVGAAAVQAHNGQAQSLRQSPGGVDSVDMAAPRDTTSVETFMARPSPGGKATVVLGGDDSNWKTCSMSVGVGCMDAASMGDRPATAHIAPAAMDSIDFTSGPDQTPSKPMRIMCGTPGAAGTLILNDIAASPEVGVSSNRFACGTNQNQGNCLTERSTTRLHQAPGGTSSIDLSDGTCLPAKTTPSANRFASGTNQNQGNWMTDRSTTRLHQAPGGNSSINLSDNSFCPPVGVSASPHPSPSPDRSSTRVRQAPGGTSSICFGDERKVTIPCVQDENVNNANVQKSPLVMEKHPLFQLTGAVPPLPGGDANIVLG